jgi:uncharacterized protein (TIGR03083 family)
MADIPQQRTIDGLREVWASIDELVAGLSDEQWRIETPLPAWDVQANVAHVIGTERFLRGEEPGTEIDVDGLGHVRNPIGAMNEAWIAIYAEKSPAEMLASFREITDVRLGELAAMSSDEWNRVGPTPAGDAPYGRFMQIRVFDCWMHEQDIRVAVDRPGHETGLAVEISLDEIAAAMGFVVGKRAGAPQGASVTFDLTGPAARRIHVAVGERAAVVPQLDGDATTTLTMPVISFTRLAGGRLDAEEHRARAEIDGDTELGERVLVNLGYTI